MLSVVAGYLAAEDEEEEREEANNDSDKLETKKSILNMN